MAFFKRRNFFPRKRFFRPKTRFRRRGFVAPRRGLFLRGLGGLFGAVFSVLRVPGGGRPGKR